MKRLTLCALLILGLGASSCEEVPSEDTITEQNEKTDNPPRPEFTTTNDYLYVDVVTVGEYTYNCITNSWDTEAMWCDRVSEPNSTTTTTRY
jgi:hypothetical protein